MEHFKLAEFACPCCGECRLKTPFADKLDWARGIAGIPFEINSGYRCGAHNIAVGGSSTSSHPDGWAADIEAETSRKRFKIIDGLIKAGVKRIGVAKTFIHADDDPDKDSEVMWLY